MVEQVCTGQQDCGSGMPAIPMRPEWGQADGALRDLTVSSLRHRIDKFVCGGDGNLPVISNFKAKILSNMLSTNNILSAFKQDGNFQNTWLCNC